MGAQQRFWWGLFGSVLPEIIRLKNLVSSGQELPEFTWPFIFISLIYIVAAGLFVVAWQAENPFKAMWVGASVPTLVSAMLQAAPSLPTSP